MGSGRRWAVYFTDNSTAPPPRDIPDPPGFILASIDKDDSALSRPKKDAEAKLRALSVVWTNPLVATLGMSLTIPLAMVADMVIHGRHFSAVYMFGCIQVFAGFIIANPSDNLSDKAAEL